MPVVLRFFSVLPLWLLHALGAALGGVAFCASARYRQRFCAHAALAGYSFGAVRAAVAHAGRMVAELPRLWLGAAPPRPRGGGGGGVGASAGRWVADLPRLWLGAPLPCRLEGGACVEQAYAAGRGIVYLTPHQGCFELSAQAAARRWSAAHGPITVLYRPARQAWLARLMATARNRPGMLAVPTTLAGVRQMLLAPRPGEAVGLLPDQVPPAGQGHWAPFFGRDAYTMTLAVRLARQTGAAIVLARSHRAGALRAPGLGARFRPPLRAAGSAAGQPVGGRRVADQPGHGAVDQTMPRAVPLGLCTLQAAARRGCKPCGAGRMTGHVGGRMKVLLRLGGRLVVPLMRVLAHLPLPVLRGLGWLIGCILFVLAAPRRRVALRNLALCYPDACGRQRRQWARETFVAFCQSWLDRSWLWFAPREVVLRRVRLQGALEELEGSQPAIIFAPHFYGMDAGGSALALHTPRAFTSIFSTQPDPAIDAWFRAGRQRFGDVRMLNRSDGVKPIVSSLRQGGLLYLLPDMDFGRNDSLFVPFYGVRAATVP